MTTRLNLKKWNEKRLPIEEQITVLKELLRTPGRGGSSEEYGDLAKLQYEATILYMARAHQRQKLHALVMVSYRHDPSAPIFDDQGEYLNTMVKLIDPMTLEEQADYISLEMDGLLKDLYQEVRVIVTTSDGVLKIEKTGDEVSMDDVRQALRGANLNELPADIQVVANTILNGE